MDEREARWWEYQAEIVRIEDEMRWLRVVNLAAQGDREAITRHTADLTTKRAELIGQQELKGHYRANREALLRRITSTGTSTT